MDSLWSFLLQTLTASGAAALLLAVKAMFRDKLSPRWQFAVWGVLGLTLAVPAGRRTLFNWPWLVEALRSALTGEYGALARVTVPVPLPPSAPPRDAADWLYLLYAAGAAALLARYAVSYLRLRLALRRGNPADESPVRAAAEKYGLPACPAVEVEGLPSAFVCGVFRPVLALPAGETPDEKVLLHELLHLKYHDAAWGLVICLFKCLHWCNPLLRYCAARAENDLESLCDQRVLERLEGEDRRDYGRVLLRMASEKYARTPGTSSLANGGKNIRRRVQAIARFKQYPSGMALVSVCVALVLTPPLLLGTPAQAIPQGRGTGPLAAASAMAAARTAACTTPAGAFDAYAKAVLDGNVLYRAMCAPLSEQNALAAELTAELAESRLWNPGVSEPIVWQDGYQIYNLTPAGEGYEGLLAVNLSWAPEGEEWDGTVHSRWMAVQPLRAEKEGKRWIIRPLAPIRTLQGDARQDGNRALPAWVYEARAGDFTLRLRWQTLARVDGQEDPGGLFFSSRAFNTTPQPGAEFTTRLYSNGLFVLCDGERPGDVYSVGASVAPMAPGEERPRLPNPGSSGPSGGSSSSGGLWGVRPVSEWEEEALSLGGSGSTFAGKDAGLFDLPDRFAANLYLNGKKAAELTLLPVEGGWQNA